MKNLVLVEDDEIFVESLKFSFSQQYDIMSFGNAESYLDYLKTQNEAPDVMVLDYTLPGMSGFDLFKQLKNKFTKTHFIMLSANDDGSLLLGMIRKGLRDYVIKDEHFVEGLNMVLEGDIDAYLELLK